MQSRKSPKCNSLVPVNTDLSSPHCSGVSVHTAGTPSPAWARVVLYSPGMLRRCPVPTSGRIPILRISWYLRSTRSFCGDRLLPACPRRSGPGPFASSPASSPTLASQNYEKSKHTAGWPKAHTGRYSVSLFASPGGYIRGAPWRRSSRFNKLYSFIWQATKHTSKLRGAPSLVCV